MTTDVVRLIVALALFIAWIATLGWALVERTLRLAMIRQYERLIEREQEAWCAAIERISNVQTIGTPTLRPVEIARTLDAEERVQRAISEDTIARGVETLRHTYSSAHMAIPTEEELRSEVLTMLGGNEPVIEHLTPPRT